MNILDFERKRELAQLEAKEQERQQRILEEEAAFQKAALLAEKLKQEELSKFNLKKQLEIEKAEARALQIKQQEQKLAEFEREKLRKIKAALDEKVALEKKREQDAFAKIEALKIKKAEEEKRRIAFALELQKKEEEERELKLQKQREAMAKFEEEKRIKALPIAEREAILKAREDAIQKENEQRIAQENQKQLEQEIIAKQRKADQIRLLQEQRKITQAEAISRSMSSSVSSPSLTKIIRKPVPPFQADDQTLQLQALDLSRKLELAADSTRTPQNSPISPKKQPTRKEKHDFSNESNDQAISRAQKIAKHLIHNNSLSRLPPLNDIPKARENSPPLPITPPGMLPSLDLGKLDFDFDVTSSKSIRKRPSFVEKIQVDEVQSGGQIMLVRPGKEEPGCCGCTIL